MKRTMIRVDADLIRRLSAAVDGVEKHTAKLDAFARVLGFPHQTAMMGALADMKAGRPDLTWMMRDVFRQAVKEAMTRSGTIISRVYSTGNPVDRAEAIRRAEGLWEYAPDLDRLLGDCRRGLSGTERFLCSERLSNVHHLINLFNTGGEWDRLKCAEAAPICKKASNALLRTDAPAAEIVSEVFGIRKTILSAWRQIPEKDRAHHRVTPGLLTLLAVLSRPGMAPEERESELLAAAGHDYPHLRTPGGHAPKMLTVLREIVDIRRSSDETERSEKDSRNAVLARKEMTDAIRHAAHSVVKITDGWEDKFITEDTDLEVIRSMVVRASGLLRSTPDLADAVLRCVGARSREKKLGFLGVQILMSG